MTAYRSVYSETLDESYFPLRRAEVRIHVDAEWTTDDVPPAARRRYVLEALRRAAAELAPDDMEVLREAATFSTSAPDHNGAVDPDSSWVQPAGMDLRIVKSAHRIVQEIARRGQSGRAVLAAELVQDGLVSAPTMSRLLNPDEKAGEYLAPFILVTPSGRTRALDLTPKGRVMASKIRAGVVPT